MAAKTQNQKAAVVPAAATKETKAAKTKRAEFVIADKLGVREGQPATKITDLDAVIEKAGEAPDSVKVVWPGKADYKNPVSKYDIDIRKAEARVEAAQQRKLAYLAGGQDEATVEKKMAKAQKLLQEYANLLAAKGQKVDAINIVADAKGAVPKTKEERAAEVAAKDAAKK